ncbi:MAG: hypothetical protein KY439_01490 [Actinobacteria bacterium]|nr:hypothetical protein [Actinomycetota bacterium]
MKLRARRGHDRGSVLMLVPAAVLVLLVLAAIAIDSAIVVLAQRDLSNRTAAAANDVAGSALSEASFYGSTDGGVRLDQRQATAFVDLAFSDVRRPSNYQSWSGRALVDGQQVVVDATARVRYLFAPAIPGAAKSARVTARSTATARGG